MNPLLKSIVENLVPKNLELPLRFYWHRKKGVLDKEMFYVDTLLDKRRRFLDIGANLGMYSYYFSKTFESVNSFEPISEITTSIKALQKDNIVIHNVALSNAESQLDFFIPLKDGVLCHGLASLEPREPPFEKRTVEVKTLDSYGFDDVDLIKIDVEGHEFSVIEGAVNTIARSKPLLIVEIEQRHINMPIIRVFDLIFQQNYKGYFIFGNSLLPLDKFSYATNQEPYLDNVMQPSYVNNFIFLPKDLSLDV